MLLHLIFHNAIKQFDFIQMFKFIYTLWAVPLVPFVRQHSSYMSLSFCMCVSLCLSETCILCAGCLLFLCTSCISVKCLLSVWQSILSRLSGCLYTLCCQSAVCLFSVFLFSVSLMYAWSLYCLYFLYLLYYVYYSLSALCLFLCIFCMSLNSLFVC